MAQTDLTARVKIDGARQAAAQLDDVAEAAEELEQPVELTVEAKVSQAIGSLRDLVDEAKSAQTAADALGRALGPELSAKVDLQQIVVGFERAGLSIDEITAKADELGTELRDIAGPGGANIDTLADRMRATAKSGDELTDSARGANSALANMVGNAAQDVGALGGIAGSTGVAIGQMAEYFSDATLGGERMRDALKSMAAVAGPIFLISAALQAVSGAMAASAARTEAAAARTDLLGDSMSSAADDALGLADALRGSMDQLSGFEATELLGGADSIINRMNDLAKSLPIVGGLAQDLEVDLTAAFTKGGASLYQFTRAVTGSTSEAQAFLDVMYAQMQAGRITGREYTAMTQAVTQYRDAQKAAAEASKLFTVSSREVGAIYDELLTKSDPLGQMTDTWAVLFREMADGTPDTQAAADAVNTLADALGLTEAEVISLAKQHLDEQMQSAAEAATATAEAMQSVADAADDGALSVEAMSDVLARLNASTPLAFADRAADTVQSFDDMKTALEELGDIGSKPLAPTAVEDLRGLSDEASNVIDAMGGMRDAIQTELIGVLESSGGSFDAFREKAAFFRGEITDQFTAMFTEMGYGPDEVDAKVTELLGNLGLLPSQVETQIRLTEAEEAMRKIELFGSALGSLPASVQAQVAAAVDENDPVRAWELIQSGVAAQGAAEVDVAVGEDTATSGIEAITGATYGTTVDVEADPKSADRTVDAFTSEQRSTEPVKVDANTAAAISTMLYLKILATILQPEVTVTANTDAARRSISDVSSLRPRVPVEAYLSSWPTAYDIAQRIGTVRVAVAADTQRLTGTRGG